MKRKFIPFILLVSTIFVMSSCFSDDNEDIVLTDEVGITAFSLGTQKIVCDTVGKSGKDSTYQSTLDCSSYVFYIDQTRHEIYNPDSLPVGIDAKKIICTVTAKSSSTALIKNVDSDTINIFSSSDSIDFSQPRTFRMLSLSGRATVDYTVKVNIHQEKPNVFKWKLAATSPAIADMTDMRAIAVGRKVYVMGRDIDRPRIYVADEAHTVAWREVTPNVELGTDFYKNTAVMGGAIYAYAKDGALYRSADAETWVQVSTPSLRQLIGASSKRLYAISQDGALTASADGTTWTAQTLDTPADSLPTGNYSIMVRPLTTNKKIDRLVLVGTSARNSQVWSYVEETESAADPQPWTYLDVAQDNRFRLPNMTNMQALYYDNYMLAMGGECIGGGTAEPYAGLYASIDGGMTWRVRDMYALPSDFNTGSNRFALAKDSQNYLWLIDSNGTTWRGRINRLGWQTGQTYFGQ